jgi:hypothetical protein
MIELIYIICISFITIGCAALMYFSSLKLYDKHKKNK